MGRVTYIHHYVRIPPRCPLILLKADLSLSYHSNPSASDFILRHPDVRSRPGSLLLLH